MNQRQKKYAISVPIKDFIHQHPMALTYDTPRPGRSSRHALAETQPHDMQFYDKPGWICYSQNRGC